MPTADTAGVVDPSILYREDEAMRRMGWGRHALTEAKKRGLRAIKSGKRNYYLGATLIEFVQRDASQNASV